MPPSQQHSRIDTRDLKAQIERKIGHERARRYMGCLSRYLFHLQKPTQTEFTKQVCSIIGVENIVLHNQLVRGIVANAQRKIPPPPQAVPTPPTAKPLKGVRRRVQVPGPLSNSNCNFSSSTTPSSGNEDGSPPPSTAAAWIVNGDAFSPSTRKWRSRKGRDRRSPLGPHGKPDVITLLGNEMPVRPLENGDINSCDLYRPLHHPPGAAEQPDANVNNGSLPPLKRQCIKSTVPQEQISVDSKPANEVLTVEYGDEDEQVDVDDDRSIVWVESLLRAPLGVPFCSASVGAAKRSLRNSQISYLTTAPSNQQEGFASDELLPDVETLQKQMEQRAVSEGLQGVSVNAAKLLSQGVDVFLKKLIKSAIELKRARSCQEQDRLVLSKQNPSKTGQGVNGVWPGHSMHAQSTGTVMESAQKARSRPPLSLVDFKVAMELNPQQLGEDWPLQMEKISFRVAEEE